MIASSAAFERFQKELRAGTVDISLVLPSKIIRVGVAATRALLQTGLGQSAVRIALHDTLPNVEALVGKAERALEGVLSILQEHLNLPFKDADAGHLGNFEIFELHPWVSGGDR